MGPPHRAKFTEGLLDTERILKALNIRAGQTILDAGCGTGYMARLFSKEAAPSGKVYALDTDKFFISTIEKEAQGTAIQAVAGDITGTTPLRESSVDLVYVSTVIHIFSPKQFKHTRSHGIIILHHQQFFDSLRNCLFDFIESLTEDFKCHRLG